MDEKEANAEVLAEAIQKIADIVNKTNNKEQHPTVHIFTITSEDEEEVVYEFEEPNIKAFESVEDLQQLVAILEATKLEAQSELIKRTY